MKHAFLSPSGAKLDLLCPGNRHLQAKCPNPPSQASARGTGMHALAAACLRRNHNTAQYIGWWCGENEHGADFLMRDNPGLGNDKIYSFQIDAVSAQNVQIYVDHVRRVVEQLPGAIVGIETPVHISEDCWGTADSGILQPYGTAHVSDYKNGFMYVSEWTEQLKLYLIGLIGVDNPFEIQRAFATIVQPNAEHEDAVRTAEYKVDELLAWYNDVYAPAAAECRKLDARLVPGDHCRECFCNARHSCPALAALGKEIAQGMFSVTPAEQPASLPAPSELTPEQRARVLTYGPIVTDWIESVKQHEYALALKGANTWGKLVKGRSQRSWADEDVAEQRLNALLHGEAYERVLLSPAKAEKALQARGFKPKTAKEQLQDIVAVTDGSPRLVAADAKGVPYVHGEGMFN